LPTRAESFRPPLSATRSPLACAVDYRLAPVVERFFLMRLGRLRASQSFFLTTPRAGIRAETRGRASAEVDGVAPVELFPLRGQRTVWRSPAITAVGAGFLTRTKWSTGASFLIVLRKARVCVCAAPNE